MKIQTLFLTVSFAGLVLLSSARAATQTDSWTYLGGSLNPNTYSALGDPGKYRPPTLFTDPGNSHGASISVAGATAGGLGSSTSPDGYGFYYTLFSSSVTFTLQTATVIAEIDKITISFESGGGTSFSQSSLTLNYNAANPNVAAATFSSTPGENTPMGELTNFSWTWNVGALGTSTGFSTSWTVGMHTSFANGQLVQQTAVPEPSSLLLASLGLGGFLGFRRSRRQSA